MLLEGLLGIVLHVIGGSWLRDPSIHLSLYAQQPISMNSLALIPILILAQASFFDMQGTITDVLAPNILSIDGKSLTLDGVDTSGLNLTQNYILMSNLRGWLIGKDVYVKGNYAYFDLNGSYSSESINEMIQKEIQKIKDKFMDYAYAY